MTTEAFTFQYWQDGQGTWQWQLNVYTKSPETNEAPALKANSGSHRTLASGSPSLTKEEVLTDIDLVMGSKTATIVQSAPVDLSIAGNL